MLNGRDLLEIGGGEGGFSVTAADWSQKFVAGDGRANGCLVTREPPVDLGKKGVYSSSILYAGGF